MSLPPDCLERDWAGASNEALLACLSHARLAPEVFLSAIVDYVREQGCTYNQRRLLQAALDESMNIIAAGATTGHRIFLPSGADDLDTLADVLRFAARNDPAGTDRASLFCLSLANECQKRADAAKVPL